MPPRLASAPQRRCWLPLAVAIACGPPPQEPDPPGAGLQGPDAEKAAVSALVEEYAQSVNEADTSLAGEVWLTSDGVSFTNPGGRQAGWDAIRQNIYERAMGESFSERVLTPGDVTVNVHGDTAVAEFEWVFDATRREDGVEVREEGWETQVYTRTEGGRWRLVHVHYQRAR